LPNQITLRDDQMVVLFVLEMILLKTFLPSWVPLKVTTPSSTSGTNWFYFWAWSSLAKVMK
jgi:hypothetical protein